MITYHTSSMIQPPQHQQYSKWYYRASCWFLLLYVCTRQGLARARFASWSTPSCLIKHFANFVGALSHLLSIIKYFANFSSGKVVYFFIGYMVFTVFWRSTSVNARFLWNQHILGQDPSYVRVIFTVFIVYTRVHYTLRMILLQRQTVLLLLLVAVGRGYTSSDYCCVLLLLLCDRLCVHIYIYICIYQV